MTQQVETYIKEHENDFLEDLKGWLRIPSISTLPEHAGDIRRAAEYAAGQLRQIGFEHVGLIQTQGHPLVYAEWLHVPGKPTLLIYGHYDVQPVDPVALWQSPPFEPVIRGDNLYCRGACDDKGQTMLVFKAMESLMMVNGSLPVNVKVLIEGEEEAGGESIASYVRNYPDRLRCDAVFICDTGMPSKDIPALVYGLRGITYTEVEVHGARRDLHSGEFGGIAPNPLHALALIIAGLKDAESHIHIPGLYEKVRKPTPEEQRFWQEDPLHIAGALIEEMGTQPVGEAEYPPLERLWARPTLEVHGISGGFTGEGAKTVIPAIGKAKISLRLPPYLKSDEAFALFERRVRELAPQGVEVTVHNIHGGEGVLVSPDSPPMRAAAQALKETFGREPALICEGGSIPIAALFHEVLDVPIVMMGFGLPDDNLHSPNEKYSLTQFFKGIRTVASFLQKLGE